MTLHPCTRAGWWSEGLGDFAYRPRYPAERAWMRQMMLGAVVRQDGWWSAFRVRNGIETVWLSKHETPDEAMSAVEQAVAAHERPMTGPEATTAGDGPGVLVQPGRALPCGRADGGCERWW